MITRNDFDHILSSNTTLVDADGDKVGKVGQIFVDAESGEPTFITVHTGLFGMNESFVPAAEATYEGDEIRVPFDKATIKDAPNIGHDGAISPEDEDGIYSYYGTTRDAERTMSRYEYTGAAGTGTAVDHETGHDRLADDRLTDDRIGDDRVRDDRVSDDRSFGQKVEDTLDGQRGEPDGSYRGQDFDDSARVSEDRTVAEQSLSDDRGYDERVDTHDRTVGERVEDVLGGERGERDSSYRGQDLDDRTLGDRTHDDRSVGEKLRDAVDGDGDIRR